MVRQDLSAMLSTPPQAEQPPTVAGLPERSSAPTKVDPAADIARGAARDAVEETGYRSFARKETRVRDDQYAALTAHARRLTRVRPAGTERITENTLIRVAIDLLLAKSDQLAGGTEPELRKSVGL